MKVRSPKKYTSVSLWNNTGLLAVDIGNSRIKLGFSGRRFIAIDTALTEYPEKLRRKLKDIIKRRRIVPVDAVMISVVPKASRTTQKILTKILSGRVYTVDRDQLTGLLNRTQTPVQTGIDRLINAYGVHHEYGGSAIIAGMGTANTYDLLDARGNFCGGCIAPGAAMMAAGLAEKTAALPHVKIIRPKAAIGQNTREALQCGLYGSLLGQFQTIVSRMAARFKHDKWKLVVTGGNAALLIQDIRLSKLAPCLIVDPELTMKALARYYRHIKDGE